MSKTPDNFYVLPKGLVVHVEDFPVELQEDTLIKTATNLKKIAVEYKRQDEVTDLLTANSGETMIKPSTETKLVRDILINFMESIEEWSAKVEGTPTKSDLIELDKIYDMTEVELRFTINSDRPVGDDTESTPSSQAREK